MRGWLKLFRTLLNHPRKRNPHWVALWIHLLLSADHSGVLRYIFGGKEIVTRPGQLIASRKSLAQATGLSEWQVERLLTTMENAQEIAQETDNRSRLITIINWSKYQDPAQPKAHTPHRSSTGPAHTQEGKKLKSEEGKVADAPLSFTFPSGLEDPKFQAAWGRWVIYRLPLKPIKGDRQSFFDRQLAKCAQLGALSSAAKLETAMLRGWQYFDFDDKSSAGSAPAPDSAPTTHQQLLSECL